MANKKTKRIKHPQVAMCQWCKSYPPVFTHLKKDGTYKAYCADCDMYMRDNYSHSISIVVHHKAS